MVDIKRERPKRRLARNVAFTTVIAVVGVLGFCQIRPASPRVAADALYVDSVRAGAMTVEVRAVGTLVPDDIEWLSAATEGRVERIHVEAGDVVEPDAVLLELSNPQVVRASRGADLEVAAGEAELRSRQIRIESDILTQEAVVAAARAQYDEAADRARADAELAKEGLTPAIGLEASRGRARQLAVRAAVEEKRLDLARRSEGIDLSAARARLDQLRAAAALHREERESMLVRAGRRVVVQHIAVEVGARVSTGTNLARVATGESLKAVLQISQLDAPLVSPQQKAHIDTHDQVLTGTVARIDPAVQNGTVNVDVTLPTPLPRGVRPDQTVEGTIEIDRVEKTLVLRRPVHARANTTISLFRLTPDGRGAERVRVQLGRTSFDSVEVLSGLRAGDRVILSDTTGFDKFDHITIPN